MARDIPQHDRQIIEQLTSSVKTLEAWSSGSVENVEGLRQNNAKQTWHSTSSDSIVFAPDEKSPKKQIT
jgi:hypothetical protein